MTINLPRSKQKNPVQSEVTNGHVTGAPTNDRSPPRGTPVTCHLSPAPRSDHARLAVAGRHLANYPRLVPLRVDELQNRVRLFPRHDGNHADAHIENLIKLRLGHTAAPGEDLKNRRHLPSAFADEHIAIRRQHPRNVVHESAARDMSESVNHES